MNWQQAEQARNYMNNTSADQMKSQFAMFDNMSDEQLKSQMEMMSGMNPMFKNMTV